MTQPAPYAPGRFMPHTPDVPNATRQARKRRAKQDRERAAQVRRSRIDEALAARERAIRAGFRSAA